jgi:acyl-coenzyme A synthetase/AMP-(fatty) acid ligase
VTILPDHLHMIDLVKAIGAYDNALCFITSAMCRVLISCAPPSGVLYPRLRALVAGGGFVYPDEKVAVLDRVSPNFYESYGASGFSTLSVLSPKEIRERPASVGRAPSFVEVQVVDDAGRPLPAGTVGRLRCRRTEGKGFAADVDPLSDERFRDGWYYPGDSAQLDEAYPGDVCIGPRKGPMPGLLYAGNTAHEPIEFAANWTAVAKFDGEFAPTSQTYAGTGTLRYSW